MKFIVGNLHTGRIGQTVTQRHLQLHSSTKEIWEGFKGAKAKNRIWLLGRSTSVVTGTGWFSSPQGLKTINRLHQQKAFFQFSYQMKARVKVDRELIWLGLIPCKLKLSLAGRGGDGTAGLRWSWQKGVSMVQPYRAPPNLFHFLRSLDSVIIEMLKVDRCKLANLSKTKWEKRMVILSPVRYQGKHWDVTGKLKSLHRFSSKPGLQLLLSEVLACGSSPVTLDN